MASDETGTLCQQCSTLSFRTLFTTPRILKKLDDVNVPLDTLREIWQRQDCSFCQLLKHTITEHYGLEYVEAKLPEEKGCILVCNQSPYDLQLDIVNDPNLDRDQRIALYLELHTSEPRLQRLEKQTGDEYEGQDLSPKLQLVMHADKSKRPKDCALFGRVVEPGAIGWSHVAKWLSLCGSQDHFKADKTAPEDTNPATNTPPAIALDFELTVIDAARGCIMSLPQGAEYIALSYMWGKDQKIKQKLANRQQMEQPGFFNCDKNRPSTTIVHAMEVTRKLGVQYLWVDALCITQDDVENILANVNRMDQVYAAAWLTIVAAAGIDADSGLPGVDKVIPRKQVQKRINVRGLTVANMLDSHSDVINFSRWNTRGWTYQERLLSGRLLTFTDSQVFYECDKGCYGREDVHVDDGTATMTDFDARYTLDFESRDLFEAYGMALAEYSRRSFTDPKDKIRAFLGALNRLTEPFRGPFYFGLPSTLFDVALLWSPVGACARDRTFPSWCWAGWEGPMRYQKKDSFANMCECTASQVEITAEGEVLSSVVECPTQRREELLRGGGEEWERHVDEDTLSAYYTQRPKPLTGENIRYPRPLNKLPDEASARLAAGQNGVLDVQGRVARFRLTDKHTHMFVLRSTCDQGRHIQCHISVFDIDGRVAGTVYVDGTQVAGLKNKDHKFLALSRTTLNRTDVDPAWDEDEQWFRSWHHPESGTVEDADSFDSYNQEPFDLRVFKDYKYWPVYNVLLLSGPDEDGVVERLGIGKVHVDAFDPVAVEELVKLG